MARRRTSWPDWADWVDRGGPRGHLAPPRDRTRRRRSPPSPASWPRRSTTQLDHLGDAGYAARLYAEHSLHRPGDRLRCHAGEETVEGTFLGFDRRGFLRLEVAGREMQLAAGEVATA